jgi:hypothetical protein
MIPEKRLFCLSFYDFFIFHGKDYDNLIWGNKVCYSKKKTFCWKIRLTDLHIVTDNISTVLTLGHIAFSCSKLLTVLYVLVSTDITYVCTLCRRILKANIYIYFYRLSSNISTITMYCTV